MTKNIVDKVKIGVTIQKNKEGVNATFHPPINNKAFASAADKAGVDIQLDTNNNHIVSIFGTKEQIEGLIGYKI